MRLFEFVDPGEETLMMCDETASTGVDPFRLQRPPPSRFLCAVLLVVTNETAFAFDIVDGASGSSRFALYPLCLYDAQGERVSTKRTKREARSSDFGII